MEHAIEFSVDPAIALVRTLGRAEVDGWRRYHDELLADARYVPGMPMLVDHSGLDATRLTADQVRAIADVVASYEERLHHGPRAIVAPGPLRFGFGRMAQQRMDPAHTWTAVFEHRADAERWLKQRTPQAG
ncbi:MAG TPA: hypothetical protein VNR63_02045 [Gaiellaceae bacterium]|nr:hypothetical protein [Gaiellaceae bacterium]